jgi:C-terminal peptidase prc
VAFLETCAYKNAQPPPAMVPSQQRSTLLLHASLGGAILGRFWSLSAAMSPLLRILRSCAAALLLAAGAAFAAAPAPDDESIASVQAAYQRAVRPGEQADLHRALVAEVLNRVRLSYAVDVDLPTLAAVAIKALEPLPAGSGEPAEVFSKAINTALGTLDPYSRYLGPAARAAADSTRFGGLGLEVESSEGAVLVVAPISGTPAARAGLQAGDLILRVDDQSLVGLPLADAVARLRGAPGTQVSLTVRRTGVDNEITVSLTRDTIRPQPLRWTMEDGILVLRLGNFSGPVTTAMRDAIVEATGTRSPQGVVLDLRGNPGGLLREAVNTADTFLAQGEIASLRGRTGNQRTWQADAAELLQGVRMVVLIDRRSASASELVAAALQENGRATIMGERSFGKGTVQTTLPLAGEIRGALKLTTAYYHGPSGRTVQRAGVTPDIELVAPAQRKGNRGEDDSRQLPGTSAPLPARLQVEQSHCAAVAPAADPALSCAFALLREADVDRFVSRVGTARP